VNLHKRLQQNHMTSRYCYGLIYKFIYFFIKFELIILGINKVFRALPIAMDNMNPDIILRRKSILEQYIQVDYSRKY
jgi:hypothetical protein